MTSSTATAPLHHSSLHDSSLHSAPLIDYVHRHALEGPERRAAVDGLTGEQLPYRELAIQARNVALTLHEAGVRPGDRVGIPSPNSLAYVVLVLGLADLGAIAVPLNTRLHPHEMATNLRDAQISALVSSHALVESSAQVGDAVGVARRYLLQGEAPGWSSLGRDGAETLRPAQWPEAAGADTSTLLYTSGTTGQAKGCMLAQQTWTGYATNMTAAFRMDRDDTYLAFLPYFHIAGLGLMLSQLVLGGCVVTQAAADPAQMHEMVKTHDVTIVMVVPGISGPFAQFPGAAAPGETALRLVVSAVGLESVAVMEAVTERLGAEYIGIYGQTESGTKTTWATEAQLRAEPATYGRVMPSLSWRIVDEDDRDVVDGEPGELVLRGSTMMQGYWGRPEASAETLRHGWHHTGDVFVHEGEGLLRMVDRTKYLVKTGGENVYPQEVENVLKQHPDVADVAVAGIRDETWGETVKAFVIPRAGTEVSREVLDAFVRESIAGYKAPRYIEYVDEIPRNISGKILKNELAARPTDDSQRVVRDV